MQMRRMTTLGVAGSAALVLALTAGCSTRPDRAGSALGAASAGASRRIPGTSLSEIQPVAERIFRLHFRIDPAASAPGVLVSQPQEVTSETQPERVQDVLTGSRSRHRHLAELRLIQQGPDVLVRCIVQMQRLDTSEGAAFLSQRGDDRPTDTPIERLGPASPDYREEWVPSRRNRELEQEILRAIAEAVRPQTAPVP